MKPSRIIKSAWKQAGKPCSLKEYARTHPVRLNGVSHLKVGQEWLANKAKLKQSQRSEPQTATRGHSIVHAELNKRLRNSDRFVYVPRKAVK